MYLQNEDIIMRALEPHDAPILYDLVRNSDAHRSTTPFWRPWSIKDFGEFAVSYSPTDATRIRLAICISKDEEEQPIGVIELFHIDWIHGRAELGLTIWPSEQRGKGYGTKAITTIVQWAFRTLRLRRVYAKVFGSNVPGQRCFIKAGFVQEGRWREHFFVDGQTEDAILFGRTVHDKE